MSIEPRVRPRGFSRRVRIALGLSIAVGVSIATGFASPRPSAAAEGDPSAISLAESVLENIGGPEGWAATRYLVWNFRGLRRHHWDRWTGDIRVETDSTVVLLNVGTREGRFFHGGEEVTDPEQRREALDLGYAQWINDSYWLIMPAKLLDPGVHLADGGASTLTDGRAARKLVVTFADGTGLTPANKYDVWVADETGLVEQWAYYPDVRDPEPRFVRPWAAWQWFGRVRIATDHGDGKDWEIAAPDTLVETLFRVP
ncbi:MAG: hypothetical protein R3B81_09360 [bacterium]